ncbi:site-specific integrase [Lichenihabitans psoromatis]|uniref:site-specific integrase n=1 Tax=Lichenihabitans psoromatis TaxID=2528642 RepID=UPI001038483C|nr:site-specific integrase [Lichenihabitans psoromatis]
MALPMSRPFKHPKTGVFWLRKRVPADIQLIVGKREELRSLNTKDADEAKRLFVQALAEVETRWANLRRGPQSLTEREAHDLANHVYEQLTSTHRDNPSDYKGWRIELYDRLWPESRVVLVNTIVNDLGTVSFFENLDPASSGFSGSLDMLATRIQWECTREAEQLLLDQGLVVDGAGQLRLAKAVAGAKQRATLHLQDLARSGFGNHATTAQPVFPKKLQGTDQKRVPLDTLVDGWAAEKRPAEKTVYEWRRIARKLAAFLGTDDARQITSEDLLRWKTLMVEAGLRPKTIRDAQLAPIRAILRWGVDNRRLETNAGERVSIDVKARPGDSKRSFTDDEAVLILRAALKEKDPVLRWVPWICAYSGARVSEVCQLRKQDVALIEALWCLKFDPEAGSLKNVSSERTVPIHDAVIESGFIDFVNQLAAGPIFADLAPDKFNKRGGNGTKILGRWVRSLGLTDPRLAPNHSWRHRLKTSGRRYGLAPDIVDAITGHARRSVADRYGEFPMAALHRELIKIPDLLRSSPLDIHVH